MPGGLLVADHELEEGLHRLGILGVAGGVPDAAADIAGDLVAVGPVERRRRRPLAGLGVDAGRVLEEGARVPGRTGDGDQLVGHLDEGRAEHAVLGQRAVGEHVVDQVGHLLGVRVVDVGLERGAVDLEDRRLAAPVVDVGPLEAVADGAEEVAGVLGRELVAERLVLLPGLRHVVAELVEQLLVVPEQHRGEVVAKPVDRAVDGHRVERARREAVEEGLVEEALVEGHGEGLDAVDVPRGPGGVVVLGREHDVRPSLAGLVGKADLGLEGARGAGRAVVERPC